MVCMPLIYHSGDVAQAWMILQDCTGLIDGHQMTSRWFTLDSYLHDSDLSLARSLVRFGSILLAIRLLWTDRYIRHRFANL